MTEIEQKALALLNTVARERGGIEALPQEFSSINCWEAEALCRAIEQHEALQAENAALHARLDENAKTMRAAKKALAQDVGMITKATDAIEALQAENARLREALGLADAALRGANINMNVTERKIRAALQETER